MLVSVYYQKYLEYLGLAVFTQQLLLRTQSE